MSSDGSVSFDDQKFPCMDYMRVDGVPYDDDGEVNIIVAHRLFYGTELYGNFNPTSTGNICVCH